MDCSGEEGGPDPRYPYAGGVIGVWGFGVEDWSGHPPDSATDYMTYCAQDDWSSDWGWAQIYPFIAEVSSWELEAGVSPEPTGTLLVGSLALDGAADWFTVPGDMSDRAPTPGAGLELTAGNTASVLPVSIRTRPDSDFRNVVAEIPKSFATARSLALVTGDGRTEVDISAVRRTSSLAARR